MLLACCRRKRCRMGVGAPEWFMNFPVQNKITLGFIISVGALVCAGWLSYRATTRLTATLDMVAHTHEVIASLEAVRATLTEVETEQRGYLLTGAPPFLEDREAAVGRLRDKLTRLAQLTADNPNQKKYLERLGPGVARRLVLLDERIAVFKQSGREAAAEPGALLQGKNAMDQVQRDIAEMRAEENRLLAGREQDARDRMSLSIAMIIATGALALGAGTLAFWLLRRDLRLREQAERALQENRALLESILDHTPAVVFLKDLQGRYLFVNRRFEQIAGRSRPEIRGKTVFDFSPPELAEIAVAHQQTVLTTGEPVEVEETVLYPDGPRPHLAVKFPLRDATGKIYATAGISTDVTARKKAEDERDRFFNLSLDLLCIASGDGYFKRISPAITDMLGWSVAEFLARPFLDFVHPDDHAATLREVEKQVGTGQKVLHFENRYRHKNGTWRTLSWRSMPQGNLMYAIARDVTERKRMEEALREAKDQLEVRVQERTAELAQVNETLRQNERRFRAFIEHGGDSIALINAENKILYLSPAVLAVEGYTPEELIGHSLLENTHPEDLPRLQALLQQLPAQPGKPMPMMWRRRHMDGRWLWLEGVATNLLDDPAVGGIVTNYRDITERKQVEERAAQEQARFKLIFESVPVGIALATRQPGGQLMRIINDAHLRICGLTREQDQMPGIYRRLRHPEDSALQDELQRQLEAGLRHEFAMEKRYVRLDGQVVWVVFSLQRRSFPDGRIEELTTVVDITERKHTEAIILESAERYHTVTRATDDVIWEWNLETDALWWNENFQSSFGYQPEEIPPGIESWTKNIHPEDLERVSRSVHAVIDSGEKRWADEYRFRRADGQYAFVLDRGFVIHNAAGKPTRMLGAMIDITERRRAEEEIRTLNAELEKRVRLRTAQLEAANKELESFSYSVSHDLRAPLRHVDGFVDMLAKHNGDKLDDRGRRYLKIIADAARQMGNLIDDLLVFSRMGRMELRQHPVNLSALVHEAVAGLQPDLADREIVWKIAPLPQVQADAAMLRQVLVNLIGNAVKYTRPRQPAEIEIAAAAPTTTELVFFVRDNGVGFDMDYVNKLFGVFQRLHRADEFEGTGIGLANVQRIIHRHGGRVWAEGKIDAGATFYFTLPKSQED
jgi:PAS domain S-box-containing protein